VLQHPEVCQSESDAIGVLVSHNVVATSVCFVEGFCVFDVVRDELETVGFVGRMDSHHLCENSPEVQKILLFLQREARVELSHSFDHEIGKSHDGTQHIFLIDRDAILGLKVRTVLTREVSYARMEKAQFLCCDDSPSAVLKPMKCGDIDNRLKRGKQSFVRMSSEVAGKVEDDREIGGSVSFREALCE